MGSAHTQTAQPAHQPEGGAIHKSSYVQSLEKGLRVLEAFKPNQPSLNIAQTAAMSGLDRAGARRVLLTLQHLGYLKLDAKSFSLTPRVLTLSQHYLECLPFWQLAQSVMEELSASLDETVSIGLLDQTDIVYVLRAPARRMITYNPNIGTRIPAYLSSIGHVLLSHLNNKDLDQYIQSIQLHAYTAHTIRNKAELRRKILETRETGWSYVSQQHDSNTCGIAVGIKDFTGRVIAALNVSQVVNGAMSKSAAQHFLPRLRVAAEKLSGLR